MRFLAAGFGAGGRLQFPGSGRVHGCVGPLVAAAVVVMLVPVTAGTAQAQIVNIEQFLDQCPTLDPAYAEIRRDLKIRRDGVLVGAIACSEPVSQMPPSQFTDELIALQALRVIYYMDRGRSGHLPWTPGTFYEWMRSQIGGINIHDVTPYGGYCCKDFGGEPYFVVNPQDDFSRGYYRSWCGMAGLIGLYAHEVRHVYGFPHTSCCGIPGGCDQTYDETDLSNYAMQYWLARAFLTGDLYVGFSCLAPEKVQELAACLYQQATVHMNQFCDNRPPDVSIPDLPGGACRCGNGSLEDGEQCEDGNAADGDGCSSACRIESREENLCAASATPSELWPPDREFVRVSLAGGTAPDGQPVSIRITGIRQDEPVEGRGAGTACPDGAGVGTNTAILRAERWKTGKGRRDGREYQVTFIAEDRQGGSCKSTVTVCVPRKRGARCVDEGPLFDSAGACADRGH